MKNLFFVFIVLFYLVNSSAQNITTLEQQLQANISITQKIDILDSIAYLIRNKDIQKCFSYIEEAYQLAKKYHYNLGIAREANMKGWYYHYKKDYLDSALFYYEESYRYYTQLKNEERLCKLSSEIGLVHHQKNNMEKAIEYQIKALTIAEKSTTVSPRLQGTICYRIAHLYIEQDDIPKSIIYLEKALSLYEKAKYKVGIGSVYIALGNLYGDSIKKSINYRKQALDLYTTLQDTNFIVPCLVNLSNGYSILKQYDTAFFYALKADAILEKYHSFPDEYSLKTWSNLSLLYLDKKDHDKAVFYMNKTIQRLQNAEKNITYLNKKDIYMSIVDIAKAIQKKDIALTYIEKLSNIKDSLYAENRTKIVYELEKKYKTEKKEQEIKLLTLQKTQETQKKQFYAILFAVSVLVLLSLALFLWYLRRLNRRLYEQKQELTQLNEVKNKLFSVISHDLRSPVYQMEQYLHTLNPVTDKEKQYHQEIQEKLFRTQNLVDTVLHWAKTQLNQKVISTGKYSVSQIIDETFEQVQIQAQNKNILLINEVDNTIFINTDKAILQIVLRNLLSNAIKFSHQNGVIRVYAKQNQGKTDIFVQDYGVGMNEQTLHTLLKDNQGKTTQGTAQEQGTGMGFQLILDYVKQLGAKIQAYSKENEGTVFQISLSA